MVNTDLASWGYLHAPNWSDIVWSGVELKVPAA